MTTFLEQAAATPATVKVGDRQMALAPLTLADMAEFRQWAKERELQAARDKIAFMEAEGSPLDSERRQEILERAFDNTKNGLAEARAAADIDGTGRLLWLSLRHGEATLTPEAVRPLVTAESLWGLQEKLDRISGFAEGPGPNGRAGGEAASSSSAQAIGESSTGN